MKQNVELHFPVLGLLMITSIIKMKICFQYTFIQKLVINDHLEQTKYKNEKQTLH